MRLTRNLRCAEGKRELRGVSLRGPSARCRIALAPKTAPFLSLNLHRAIAPLSQKLLDLELGEDLPVHATHLAARSRVALRAVLPRRARPVSPRGRFDPKVSRRFAAPFQAPTGRNPTKLTNAKLVRGFGNTRSRSHSRSAPSSPTVVVASSISPSNSVPCHLPWGSTADRSAQVYSTSLSPLAQLVCLFFAICPLWGVRSDVGSLNKENLLSRGPTLSKKRDEKMRSRPQRFPSFSFRKQRLLPGNETEKISAQKCCRESDLLVR